MLDGEESANSVDTVDTLPRLQWQFPNIRMASLVGNASVGTKNMYRAIALYRLLHARRNGSFIRDVTFQWEDEIVILWLRFLEIVRRDSAPGS